MDLFIRLECGPLGKWEICWSKVCEVDPSVGQVLDPKPIVYNKPNHNLKPNHLLIPSADPIPNTKPIDLFKPKPSRPSLTKHRTNPHSLYPSQPSSSHLQTLPDSNLSSQANPCHLSSSEPSSIVCDNSVASS